MIDVVVNGERHPGVGPINRTGGGVDEVPYMMMTASFEDIHESDEIALHIGIGIFERIADARLSGEVDDDLGLLLREKRFHGLSVGDVRPDETESAVLL